MNKSDYNDEELRRQITVKRTTEGTVFEIVIAVINIIMWAIIAWIWHKYPEQAQAYGNTEDIGSDRVIMLPLGGAGTLLSIWFCFCAYHPGALLHIPSVKFKNARQFNLGVRLTRILGVLVSLMFTAVIIVGYCHVLGLNPLIGKIPVVLSAVMMITIAWYTIRIQKQE